MSDSLGLVDFVIGLVNSVLNLRDGQVNLKDKSNNRRSVINPACQNLGGADQNNFRTSNSLLEGQQGCQK